MPRASLFRSHLLAALVLGAAALSTATPAAAQSSACEEGQKYFVERQKLLDQFNKTAIKDKKIDPIAACPILTKLANNSEAGVKWLEGNKDWCQVPDQLAAGFTKEFDNLKSTRKHACDVAAKIQTMQKQAQQRAQQSGPATPFAGGGLTGEFKVPKGAL